jgi:hypothetical protein
MQLRFIHPFGAQVSAVVGAMALAACVVCVFLGGGRRKRRKDRHNEGEEERTGIIFKRRKDRHNR